jgi:hypothetical protein
VSAEENANPGRTPVGVLTQPTEPATHRCRRCLLWFEYAPDEPIAGPTEWWLCPPCQVTLIGPSKSSRA